MKIILLLMLVPWIAFAGEGGTVTGNGGDVVVCGDKVQMLDVYEAEQLRGNKLDLGGPKLSRTQKIELAVRRIHKVDPSRARTLLNASGRFLKEVKFVADVSLRDIDDSNDAFVPKGCKREQIAIQNIRVLDDDPFYIIDKNLWDKLDEDNKVVLILHEMIFRASRGKWSSPLVRLFTSLGFTRFLETTSAYHYWNRVSHTALTETVPSAKVEDTGGLWFSASANNVESDYRDDHLFEQVQSYTLKVISNYTDLCGRYGRPVGVADLPHIENVLAQYSNLSPYPTPPYLVWMWNRKTKLPELYSIEVSPPRAGYHKLNPSTETQATAWCATSYDPFSLEKTR
jgi:hypothetical protein